MSSYKAHCAFYMFVTEYKEEIKQILLVYREKYVTTSMILGAVREAREVTVVRKAKVVKELKEVKRWNHPRTTNPLITMNNYAI